MAGTEATLLLKIKAAGQKALGGIQKGLVGIAKGTIAAAKGLAGFTTGVVAFAANASKFREVETAFTNLASKQGQDSDKMLKNMKELSAGTISEMNLMKQANNALLLGLPVERFGEMLNIARSASKATGQSMEFMLQSIVTGLGRGSRLILDNLGIVIDTNKAYENYAKTLDKTADSLTEAERKQAFINEALRIGNENAKLAGSGQLSLADRFEQTKARAQDVAVVIGDALSPAFEFLLDSAQQTFQSIENFVGTSQALEFFKVMTKIIAQVKNGFITLGSSIGVVAGVITESVSALLSGSFDRAKEIVSLGFEELGVIQNEAITRINEDNESIDILFKAKELERVRKHNQKKKALVTTGEKALTAEQMRQAKLREEIDKLTESARITSLGQFFNVATSLTRSGNKTLNAIGKAAGLTQIAINTPVAVSSANKFGNSIGGPVVGAIMGAIAAAAQAAQAAQLAGVPLAQGGIIPASAGGTPAIIGEGGQPEAVVPLDRASEFGFGGGMTINVNVNGGLLGDESSAREFAVAVDRELLKLRQDDESVSFDEGVV